MTLRKALTGVVLFTALTAAGAQQQQECQDLGTVLQNNQLTALTQTVLYLKDYPQAQPLVGPATSKQQLPPAQQFTVFAPSNQAFENYLAANPDVGQALQAAMPPQPQPVQDPQPAVESGAQPQQRRLQQAQPQPQPQPQPAPLTEEQKQQLQQRLFEVLGAHIVPGQHSTQNIVTSVLSSPAQEFTLQTLSNQTLVFTADTVYTYNEEANSGSDIMGEQRGILFLNVQGADQPAQAVLTDVDASSCTGPVHVINEVLLPAPPQPPQVPQPQPQPAPTRRLLRV